MTGHTGFKGSWLSVWLTQLGARVIGVSSGEISTPSNYKVSEISKAVDDRRLDVRDVDAIRALIKEVQPDFVFHLAAQSLVRPSYDEPLETMNTNAIGSANIMDALRFLNKGVVSIMITSDKAYDNVEWTWGYRENDRLGGKDPYSASKGMAELAIRSYVESFFKRPNSNIRIGIARAGNVIGGGDWGVDRIVPDCMRAWSKGEVLNVRNPYTTRPWQHVLEPLSGYLSLASSLYLDNQNHGEAYNFGPNADQNYSVAELINKMSGFWDGANWDDVSQYDGYTHEARLLKLNCDKALHNLGWSPVLNFSRTVMMTVEWYKHYYRNQKKSMFDYTVGQIEEYIKLSDGRKFID